MRRKVRLSLAGLIAVLTTTIGLTVSVLPASAAALTEVTGFGTNPTNLRMYLYVPNNVAALRRDGGSDPVGIKSMIDYVQQRYPVDASRITAVGLSSGAMMTNVLLGLYPDVFAAGTSWSGVPFGCFATSTGAEWNSECANGRIIKTAQQWGDLVRTAHPGYTGRRPRVQVGYSADAWNTGLTASVTVTNTGGATVNGWSLGFSLASGQRVVNAWNATVSPDTGSMTARNVSYNAGIAPGSSVGFGFQAVHTGNTARPPAFTLNGSPCTTS